MAFIRIKRISGKQYAYEVSNTWTRKGPRQKVGAYLGPVVSVEQTQQTPFYAFIGAGAENALAAKTFEEVVRLAARHALLTHGFVEDETQYRNGNIGVDRKTFVATRNVRNAVLKMNNGFLCAHSMQALLAYDAHNDPSGKELAAKTLSAGLAQDEDLFFELFEKSRKQDDSPVTIDY